MNVGIIGASGLIGKALSRRLLANGHSVVGFTRSKGRVAHDGVEERIIDGGKGNFSELDALVNLAGYPVNCRWNDERRQLIRDSRIRLTKQVMAELAKLEPSARPQRYLAGSAIGIYGDRGDEVLDEASAAGRAGFLRDVVMDWEQAAQQGEELGLQVTRVRIGIVLGQGGAAFEQMRKIFSFGLGGVLGNGEQWMPWIHLDDLAAMMEWVLASEQPIALLNGTAPEPVRNRELTRSLARHLKRPAIFPVPGCMLKLVFGGFGDSLLSSCRAVPSEALKQGFQFSHQSLDSALANLLGK